MIPFLLRRLMWFAITLFVVMGVSFVLMRSVPGGPFDDKKVVTLGVSYGGELALKAALDFPDQIFGAA